MTSGQPELDIACVILAAGIGRRFGGPKMLHTMPSGQTMIEQTIKQYQSAFCKIHIVVTQQDEDIIECIKTYSEQVEKFEPEFQSQKYCRIVECADSSKGMSASLIAGVTATIEADGWLIALGDMPYVTSDTIGRLKNSLSESNIVIPRYRQQLGNPVGFGCQFKQQMLALEGDIGGKSITQGHPECLTILDTDDQGVILDLDTPYDVR